jgi:hypothetical protein
MQAKFREGWERFSGARFGLTVYYTAPPSIVERRDPPDQTATHTRGGLAVTAETARVLQSTIQLQSYEKPAGSWPVTAEASRQHEAAIPVWLALAQQAGSELPGQILDRYGIDPTANPEQQWTALLFQALRGHRLKLVHQHNALGLTSESTIYEEIDAPFSASMTALSELGLSGKAEEARGDSSSTSPEEPKRDRYREIIQAMMLIRDHPDWSDRRIAKNVGVSPSTLSRSAEYKTAKSLARSEPGDRPRGYVHKEHGTVEAIDPDSTDGDIADQIADEDEI